jgi:RNA polymerase sigma-70 factor (ECF subfamily)
MSHDSAIRRWGAPRSPEWSLTVVPPGSTQPATSPDTYAALTDGELVSRTLAGDAAAFDVIVTRHRRPVYRVCYRFVRHHEDASDLAQEVFVRAWRGLPRFKRDAAFSTWLYRIAVNACLNRVTARQLPVEPIDDADCFEDTGAAVPGAELAREERARAVRQAIDGLPNRQRATLILRLYHEMTHQQIADILGSSVGTVKANVFHALANVKKRLGSEP